MSAKTYGDVRRADKEPVRAVAVAAITLSGEQIIDAITCIAGDDVLVTNQAAAADNGIYTVRAGAWTRRRDADTDDAVANGIVVVGRRGAAYARTAWEGALSGGTSLGTADFVFAEMVPNGLRRIVSGTAVLAGAATSITVAQATLGGTFGGKPALVAFAASPGSAAKIWSTWSGNDLIINVDVAPGANAAVAYSVDGR